MASWGATMRPLQKDHHMTKHDIYDEHEGFRLWNYMTCKKDDEGQEVWRIGTTPYWQQ
jgi:hypothetical protein